MRKAFTLIELAIVIVIIGLLVGGVLQGSALIQAAKDRKIISDINSYSAAWYAFFSKYNGYPGDLRNAETIWGTETVAGGPGTINGNGNKGIEEVETLRTWEHFQLAKMIRGSFTGSGPGKINENVPASSYSGAGIEIDFPCEPTAPCAWYPGVPPDNMLIFGAASPTGADSNIDYSIFTPRQIFDLDTKMDDGVPVRGKVLAAEGRGVSVGNCVTGATSYLLTSEAVTCTFAYIIGGF